MGKNRIKKRPRKRVAKENRKNLRLWAEGAREIILAPHLDAYQIAKDQGRRQERKLLKKICREFHARVGWRVQDHEEPVLKEWDPNSIEDEELLSDEEQAAKTAREEELNARIRRWYTYRLRKIRKSQRSNKDVDPRKDPYAVLMANLSGVVSPPKALQAYQQFMRESYETKIAPVVAEKWGEQKRDNSRLAERSKEPKAGFRAEVAREVFATLPDEERKAIADRAKQEAAAAKAEYVETLKAPPSQAPQARQRCIDGVADFMGPILQGLYTHTGMHATLIMGGPVPVFGGELRTLHVSYGRNLTVLGPHWPQWDKTRFAEVTKCMTDYLHTAYTPQDCAKSALNGGADLSNANYTIPGDPDDESGSDSTSDSSSDSDDSDSDTDTDDEEAARPPKKRKLSSTTKKNGSAHLGATPSQTSDHAAGGAHDNAANDNRPLPYLGYHISEEERQENIQRNKGLLQQLKSDVMGELAGLAAELGGKKRGSKSHKTKNQSRTRAASSGGTRKSSRLADTSVAPAALSSSPAPSLPLAAAPSTSSTASSSSTPSAALQPTSSPSFSAPSVPATESSSVPQPSPSNEPTSDDSTPPTAPPTSDSSSTPPVSLAPLSQAAHTAIASVIVPPSTKYSPCPAGAPPWFSSAHAAMTKDDLGCHYHALVAAWTRMEVASRFEFSPTNLSAKLRPKEVGLWISSSRRVEQVVTDPTAYALQWQQWWDSLQPSWRIRGVDGRWVVSEKYGAGGKEWGSLYRWGINGVLTIVASLYFWGRAVRLDAEMCAIWEAAMQDVVWIFEGMATYYEMFKGKF
ncbi:hypothetical protein R3P38DRAFT_3238013 [Favolaschia claudopus]|uniref:Uncharacterized protein n=1 Tax=Favolaschia claudopus TaxID=2862362 RepID=A0AAV9Z9W9_9AGAR